MTNRATHYAICNGVADPVEHASPMLSCRIWSLQVKPCKHEYGRTPKIGVRWVTPPWDGERG